MKSHIYAFIIGALISFYFVQKSIESRCPEPPKVESNEKKVKKIAKKKTTLPDGTIIEEEVQRVESKKQENIEYKKSLNLFSASVSYNFDNSKLLYPLQYGRSIGNSGLYWTLGTQIDSKFKPYSISAGLTLLF